MVRSMTGYGKHVIENEDFSLSVEMRSVNNRFLDFSLKMPQALLYLEESIKKELKTMFRRGKVDVYITIKGEGTTEKHLQVNQELLKQYINHFSDVKRRYSIEGELEINTLVSLPDIFEVVEMNKHNDELKENVLTAISEAAKELLEMRETEGNFLAKDIKSRLNVIEDITNRLETLGPEVTQEYKERILKRMSELLNNATDIDEVRMHQEVAILTEKGDITEEIIRLKSHVEHMRKILKEEDSIGRKLDFICQELHREANTIGSKSMAAEINHLDVLLKSEIEKIKEQVQNIE
ncbi:YicC/YloC family endoribonuclease [Oceanobacillus sp. CAU 1775]